MSHNFCSKLLSREEHIETWLCLFPTYSAKMLPPSNPKRCRASLACFQLFHPFQLEAESNVRDPEFPPPRCGSESDRKVIKNFSKVYFQKFLRKPIHFFKSTNALCTHLQVILQRVPTGLWTNLIPVPYYVGFESGLSSMVGSVSDLKWTSSANTGCAPAPLLQVQLA